jgi:hypothetical protein
MAVFATTLLGGLVAFVIAGVAGSFAIVARSSVDMLKSVVLPLVTLVLGYCFGRGGRS